VKYEPEGFGGFGFMKPWAEKFYKSKAWIECRLAFLQSKFFICERCGGAATIVHHKVYLTPKNINDPEITLNWSNLESLCQDCHNREHMSKYSPTQEGLMFNEDGDLIPARGTPPI
jgi:5-methylcytosine-specific restriction endonuclease McrA